MRELNFDVRGAGPRRGKSSRSAPPRRTELHEDGLHVATIVELVDDNPKGHGFCQWYVDGDGGHARSYTDAERQIEHELQR